MTIKLTGDVGRGGRPEDVVVVQALLANTKGPNGRAFWESGLDGRASDALAAAIEACQRHYDASLLNLGSAEQAGVVRPGSRTLQMLEHRASQPFDDIRVASTAPVVLYRTDDPRGRAARNHPSERTLPTATWWSLSAIQQGLHRLADRDGLAVAVRASGLAGDRWGFRVGLEGLTVIEADARPRAADDRQSPVPAAIWRLVAAEFGRLFEVGGGGELTGPGTYRNRTALPSLSRGPIDETVFVRMEVPRPSRHETVRLASAALGLILEARTLNQEQQDELRQIIAVVEAQDETTARLLEERWRAMRSGVNRSNLQYATNEQIREYLKKEGQYEQVLALLGLGLVLTEPRSSDGAEREEAVPVPAYLVRLNTLHPLQLVAALGDILASGAVNEAERLYQERLRNASTSTQSVAGISIAQGISRRDFLLRAYRVDLAGIRLEPSQEKELLDLMERILELQRTGRVGARSIEDEIYRKWGAYPFLEQLLRVYRDAREAITNPVNAAVRPDVQLAAYRERAAWTKFAYELLTKADFAKLVVKVFKDPAGLLEEDSAETIRGFALWVMEKERSSAFRLAKEELQRREALL